MKQALTSTDGLKGRDGTVKAEEWFFYRSEKMPVRAVRIEAGKNQLRTRLYLRGSRLLQVTVAGPTCRCRTVRSV